MSDLKGDEKSEIVTALCNICRNAGVTDIKTLDMADWLIEVGESAKSVGAFGEWYALHAEERPYLKSVKTFWEDFKNNRIPHFSKLKGGADAIDGLLDSIRAGQTAGVDYNRFIENLPSEQAALWKLSGLKWGDVRTMTIKQTDALRFSFQKVGA